MSASRRAAVWATLVSALVLATALDAASPLRDAITRRAAVDVHLVRSLAYVALAPLSNVLDTLTLLSVPQIVALFATLALLYVAWRIARRWWARATTRRELRLALRALGGAVAVVGLAVLLPRPMAALAADDPARDVILDVHSHTESSHDGRPGFDAEANRAWHRGAGFDAAYITDHKSFDGAEAGMRANPSRAGHGTVLLSGLELVVGHDHLVALGATERTQMWITVDPRRAHHDVPITEIPVLVQTIPEVLSRMPPPSADGARGVLAIELSDGSPRGIAQMHRERARILRLADSLDLALVAASDNHGWGHAAVAWSVMRIPGWRSLTPAALGARIEAAIRSERRQAVRVIERRSPDPGRSRVALALTLPAVALDMLRTLSWPERASWIVWSWVAARISIVGARRREATT